MGTLDYISKQGKAKQLHMVSVHGFILPADSTSHPLPLVQSYQKQRSSFENNTDK